MGGSAELNDLAYLTTPSGFNGRILNKYGFKTESVGALKVRARAFGRGLGLEKGEGGAMGGLHCTPRCARRKGRRVTGHQKSCPARQFRCVTPMHTPAVRPGG